MKIKKVLKYFDAAEVKKKTEEKIQEHFLQAQSAFNALNVNEEKKQVIKNYTEQLMGRNS